MMGDDDELNRASEIPRKRAKERTPKEVDQDMSNVIRGEFDRLNKDAQQKFVRQLRRGRITFTKKKTEKPRGAKRTIYRDAN